MFLNVYMSCDNYSVNNVTHEYIECVEYTEQLNNESDYLGFVCCMILIIVLRGWMQKQVSDFIDRNN